MKVSVLVPSRGRSGPLAASVASLMDNADHPGEVEVLVAVDPDEIQYYPHDDSPPVHVFLAPERYGYTRLHEYYNMLAEQATGDWLLIWNDDALMTTKGWDTVIASRYQEILWLQANHAHHANMFPAWPREWYTLLGHVSLSPHCDTWLQFMGQILGRMYVVPVWVQHDRADITGNNSDTTYWEGRGLLGSIGYIGGHEPDGHAIHEDANRIREFLRANHPRAF